MAKTIIDQLAVEYQDQGQGPVILMLHGWQDSLSTFDALVRSLPGFRIVRLDLPGFGQSQIPPENWTLENYATFISSFVAKLGISPDIALGHSFGGRVIIKAVTSRKINPSKLILMSSGGVAKTAKPRNMAYNVLAKIGKAATIFLPGKTRDNLRAKLYKSAGSDYLASGKLKQIYLNAIREDLVHLASAITKPTLIVWGGQDTETPVSDARIFARAIVGSQLAVIEKAGHFVHQTDAADVAELIKRFAI